MTIKIFTIPFNQDTAGFIEEDLNNFMLKKNIKILKPAFFESGSERYWSAFIIAFNKQLADITLKMLATFDQLNNINGFGSKKIKKYGQRIIDTVKVFDKSRSNKDYNKKFDSNSNKLGKT